jgi:hypothetical protein
MESIGGYAGCHQTNGMQARRSIDDAGSRRYLDAGRSSSSRVFQGVDTLAAYHHPGPWRLNTSAGRAAALSADA